LNKEKNKMFKERDRVKHPRYGYGEIISVKPRG
jgi:hypothetical protein